MVDRKYDIDSENIKCNFCTNYFRTTNHFADIQRYSLKACPKCIHHPAFSITHPKTYQIYKVFMIESGLIMPRPAITHPHKEDFSQALQLQKKSVVEEIHGKIAEEYLKKIYALIKEMGIMKQNVVNKCEQVAEEYEINMSKMVLPEHKEKMLNNCRIALASLKQIELEAWRNIDNSVNQRFNVKNLGDSRKKSLSKNKQNMNSFNHASSLNFNQCNNNPSTLIASNSIMSVKNKVVGGMPPKQEPPRAKESKLINKSVSRRSLSNSSRVQSSKNLVKALECHSSYRNGSQHQTERATVAKLLQEQIVGDSYLPQVVIRDDIVLKTEGTRNMIESILQLRDRTSKNNDLVQLVGEDVSKINFDCYLRLLGNLGQVRAVRMIRSSLVDADMDSLFKFLAKHPSVQSLIVTNNLLTDLSVRGLVYFKERHPESKLEHVYMGNNHIKSNRGGVGVKALEKKGVHVYI